MRAVYAVLLCLLSSLAWAGTMDRYEARANELTDSLTQREPALFNGAIDADSILDTALKGMILDPAYARGFRTSVKRSLSTQLGQRLIGNIPEGHYAKLIRVKQGDGVVQALLRLDYGDNGNAYLDMYMVQQADGVIRIVDWYDYSTGQIYTQSVRQIAALTSPTPTVIGQVFDIVTDRKESIDAASALFKTYTEKNYQKMVTDLLKLDDRLRGNRVLAILAVQAGSLSGDDKLYRLALGNLERYFSNDPGMTFLLLDYYFMKSDYAKALTSLHSVQASIGAEDAALKQIEANVLIMQGKFAEAAVQARRGITIEPDYEPTYWSLLNALNGDHSYGEAVEVAAELEQRFGYDLSPAALAKDESFQGMAQSAEYRRWKGL